MAAFAVSAAIYLFPIMLPVSETSPLFKIIALLPLNHIQFVSLMFVKQMSRGVLYALLAVSVALITMGIGIVISHRTGLELNGIDAVIWLVKCIRFVM